MKGRRGFRKERTDPGTAQPPAGLPQPKRGGATGGYINDPLSTGSPTTTPTTPPEVMQARDAAANYDPVATYLADADDNFADMYANIDQQTAQARQNAKQAAAQQHLRNTAIMGRMGSLGGGFQHGQAQAQAYGTDLANRVDQRATEQRQGIQQQQLAMEREAKGRAAGAQAAAQSQFYDLVDQMPEGASQEDFDLLMKGLFAMNMGDTKTGQQFLDAAGLSVGHARETGEDAGELRPDDAPSPGEPTSTNPASYGMIQDTQQQIEWQDSFESYLTRAGRDIVNNPDHGVHFDHIAGWARRSGWEVPKREAGELWTGPDGRQYIYNGSEFVPESWGGNDYSSSFDDLMRRYGHR